MSLYDDVHSTSGRPSDRPRVKAVLIHSEGILFVNPIRKSSKTRPANGYLQELLLTEGLPAVRSIGLQWYEGFIDRGG